MNKHAEHPDQMSVYRIEVYNNNNVNNSQFTMTDDYVMF